MSDLRREIQGAEGGGRTILLVEDEPGVRLFVQTSLARRGFRLLTAGSAAEAIRLAGEHPRRIDLAITDVVLPDMDGRRLLARLRKAEPELPAVLISGYARADLSPASAAEEGFLEKPFMMAELLEAVRRALDPAGAHR